MVTPELRLGCVATLKVGLGWAMVTGLLFAGLAAMSVVSAVSAFAQADAAKKRGELLLATNCSQCHAIGRSGASRHPDALPFRTLSTRYPIEALAKSLAEGISVGNLDMPEFSFEHDEIAAILAYLKSVQGH